jgi:AcrR family transcriptional regulator
MRAPPKEKATAQRILAAARDLLVERGVADTPMAEIAKAAGVTRQAVYLHFGSRSGLLVAMVRHYDDLSPKVAELRTMRAAPTADAGSFETYVRTWLDYVPEIYPIARVLSAAAATDAEARLAWDDRMEQVRTGYREVVTKLDAAGLLAADWTVEAAVDWCWSQSHPDAWRHLVVERDWDRELAVDRIVETLKATVLRKR